MSETPPNELPRWDLSELFPSLDSRELTGAHEGLLADIARLRALYDELGVGSVPRASEVTPERLAQVIDETNSVMDQARRIGAFIYSFISTDSSNDEASGLHSQLQQETAQLNKLSKRFEAWVGTSTDLDGLLEADTTISDHAFWISRAARAAAHQMSEAEEDLAADLRLSGSAAWARLHRDVTSRLQADIRLPDGNVERQPMSIVRGMATDPDRDVREAAYRCELDAWESVAVPLAAALNGAKGEAAVLNRRRGWADALAPALFANNVERESIDAMTESVIASLPYFRGYLRSKALLIAGKPRIAWFDLLAPLDQGTAEVGWEQAVRTVRERFATYSPGLAMLIDQATAKRWIDAEPRMGKVGGAFCMPIGAGQSRVLLNFNGSPDGVQTLAHELGHAYHNATLADRTALQRQTPMALAETASIFCETIVVEAGLREASKSDRLVMLDTDLQGTTQIVVDIHSRFLFETELCSRREKRALSVTELCEMMLDAQEKAYGDALDADLRHPYMWAVKSHYFTPFYNWPYTFGLLFGIGLYAQYQADPERFRDGYDELLSSTGLGTAADLGRRFGIDVGSRDFWDSSLDVIRARIRELEKLASEKLASEKLAQREQSPDA